MGTFFSEHYLFLKWGKVFKNGLGKIFGRQPLAFKDFTWSILEYFVPNVHCPRNSENFSAYLDKYFGLMTQGFSGG